MEIFLNILFLILGLVLLVKGADFFVGGASEIAKKLKISTFVIGITVVAIGTSLPELAVSLVSSIKGGTGLSLGNVIGSNMFNILMALGVTAIIAPVAVDKKTKHFDALFLFGVTALMLLFSLDKFINGDNISVITRSECLVLLAVLVIYMYLTITNMKKSEIMKQPIVGKQEFEDVIKSENFALQSEESLVSSEDAITVPSQSQNKSVMKKKKLVFPTDKTWFMLLSLILGLAGVVFGGECVSSTVQFLALKIGMSEMLVGATVVAVGTSLPELMVAVMAARRHETDMALGNVIGSNIFNICLVLTCSGLFGFVTISTKALIDILILFVSTLVFCIFVWCGNRINRKQGVILTLGYVAYIIYSCIRN